MQVAFLRVQSCSELGELQLHNPLNCLSSFYTGWSGHPSFLSTYRVLVAQSCPTLYDPMDCSPPGFSLRGIFHARILECVPFPSPGDLPDLGIEPKFSELQVDCLPSVPPGNFYHFINLRTQPDIRNST